MMMSGAISTPLSLIQPVYDDDVIEPDETEVIKPVLDALPLLREKGILFVKATLRS